MKQLASMQRGVAIISALFLLVVIAALGAFMLTFSNTQQLTAAQDLNGSRAYWAARAGLEWAIPQVMSTNSCPTATSTFVVDGFDVNVACATATYHEGVTVTIANLTSLACRPGPCGAGAGAFGYVERSVSTVIER